jgi:hypothetical protein
MLLRRRLFLQPFPVRRLLLRRLLLGTAVIAILVLGGSLLIREARGATEAAPANAATSMADTGLDTLVDRAASPADTPPHRLGFKARLGRHVVHAIVTVERNGKLLTFQIDRGTIGSIGGGKLAVAEVGDSSITVGTNAQTRVRRDGKRMTLADLKAGDDVYVISQITSGADPLALRIAAPTRQSAGS